LSHAHQPVIEIENLNKQFQVGQTGIEALKDINLEIRSTDFCIVYGPSGCGKTTLLNIIAGIDTPTSGSVRVRDKDIFKMPEDERGIYRSKKFGIIQQMPYWVKSLSTLENVALPLLIEGQTKQEALHRANLVLKELKIENFANQAPTELSGGQQQKASLARALVSSPWILLCDEPTGNLDSKSADEIMSLFNSLNIEYKRTIILVTHNQSYWKIGTREVEMRDGSIIKDTKT